MKRFYACMSAAMVVVLIAALSAMTFTTSAATVEVSDNVVFISDNATVGGDGKTANTPLYPSTARQAMVNDSTNSQYYNKKYYLTALYQAAEKLINTGGTIVVCGPVVIDGDDSYGSSSSNRDFILPESDKPIVITSVYNGVNYKTNGSGAYLGISEPAQITLGAPTEFENIAIKTTGTLRAICANGNKIVMGQGIDSSNTSGTNNSSTLLSIVGGTRYNNFTGDTDITIKSGRFANICGSMWTNGASGVVYKHTGNVKISIEGGIINGYVCGGSNRAIDATQDGDIQIDLYAGATFGQQIYATGKGRFATEGNIVEINVYGGSYYNSSAKVSRWYSTAANYEAGEYRLNISNASLTAKSSGSSANFLLDTFITSATGFDITYPAAWITSVSMTNAPATPVSVLKGESLVAEGAELLVNYQNKYDNTTTYTNKVVKYDPADKAFTVACDTSTAGTKTATYKYGTNTFYTSSVEVIEVPTLTLNSTPELITNGNAQGIRFVANTVNTLQSGMTIEEYGIISVTADVLNDASKLNFEQTAGMTVLAPQADDYDETTSNGFRYSGTVSNIPLNRAKVDYIAKAYMKLAYNGETFYVYSNPVRKNVYELAKAVIAGTEATQETKTYLQTNVINAFDNYDVTQNYADTSALRAQVVAYMRAQMNMEWTPSESFWLYNGSGSSVSTNLYFEAGKTYSGIPYTNNKSSQLESFEKYMTVTTVTDEETGEERQVNVLDLNKLQTMAGVIPCGKTEADKTQGYQNYMNFPGSDCSTSVITSWNTIINNRSSLSNGSIIIGTRDMIPGASQNTVKVGDYTCFDEDGNAYVYTTDILERNGRDAIYAAYDQLQPGDATVYYKSNTQYGIYGHMRMVSSVDPVNQTVTVIECINNPKLYNCWAENTYTYEKLFTEGSIPIAIPELVTGHSDEETTIVTDLSLDKDLANGVVNGTVKSNRQIIYVEVEISDGNDVQTVYYKAAKSTKWRTTFASTIDLSNVDLSDIELTEGTEYTFTLKICLPGEVLTPIENYSFVA
ncbi:MAG: hypothetical protein E7593_00105 [Ruminococcaceae bacterium]|nr:hypothetical protein [Oscillospiraceae bacterium]